MLTLMRFNMFLIFLLIYLYIFSRLKRIKNKKTLKEFMHLAFILSVIFIIALTILPESTSLEINQTPNLVPFKTIIHFINNPDFIEFSFNIIGNIILFIPFGFFLYFKEKGNKKAVLIFCLIFTVCIEICQLILPMRQTDIDDLILNFLGGYMGMKLAEKYAKIDKQ